LYKARSNEDRDAVGRGADKACRRYYCSAGKEFGLEQVRLMRQADYLIRLGLLDRLQQMIERGEQDFESLKARLALKNFFVPGGISDHFKVLVQQKNLGT